MANDVKAKEFVSKVEEQAKDLMVSFGIDEPLQETEYGMVNPYRTGLAEFLAQEEQKERELLEVEQAR